MQQPPHDWLHRHTYCSHLAQGGAPTRAIQALAGHQSARTTERYMHLAPSHVEQAITHLPVVRPYFQKFYVLECI